MADLKIAPAELREWMASSLAADLRLGDASEFRKLLPYPQVMSAQRRKELHQNWIAKIANSRSNGHEVAHVVVHILARMISRPIRIYQPFGDPVDVNPQSDATKLPVVFYKGAYYLGQPPDPNDADLAASIARGPERTSIPNDEEQRLDRLLGQAHDLLLDQVEKAERNPHPATRHWPALRETVERRLAVILRRPESPLQQVDILTQIRTYLNYILRPSLWKDEDPRPQGGRFTQYFNVISDAAQTTLSVDLSRKRLRLHNLQTISVVRDRIAVDFGMDGQEGFAVARVPYTATDGTEKFIYREFSTRLTAADLEVVRRRAAEALWRKVQSTIRQLSARETGRELAAFEQWADAVFHLDRAEGDAGPLDVFYGTVLKIHGERLAQAGVTTVAELGVLVARHLAADLGRGDASEFRKLLPYPENMSEQRREALHQHLLNKLVHRQPGYPDVVHVVPHIVAWGLGLPMAIHHPFGAPYIIGPPSGDGEIPQPVVWLDGAYHLGQPRDPHDARIAEGFPSPAAYTELRRLDVVFDEALDLLKAEVDTAEQNTAIRHWPLLQDTFHRNLAAIRQRPSSPRRHIDVLEEHRRYADALREESTWEDENRWNLQDPFTVPGRAEDTPGWPSLLRLRARRDGDDMLLGVVDRVAVPGDRVAVDFGEVDGEGVGIVRIPYTAPDGTERFVYKEIARRLTDSELAELWSTAAGPVWETVDRWTFGTLYHITAPVSESGIFDITFGGQRVTIPPVEVADGLPPVIAAELKEARFRLGYGMDSRPLAVLEVPAGRNGTGAPLYLELSSPAPTAYDIERLRSMALWESAEPGALLDEVSIDLVMQEDMRTPYPLPLTLGDDNSGRTLDGQEVDLSPGTEVALRVGRFLRLEESNIVTSIFAAVKAPLADRSGNAYRLIYTNLPNEWFDGFKTQWETTGSGKRPAGPEWPAGPLAKRPRTGDGLPGGPAAFRWGPGEGSFSAAVGVEAVSSSGWAAGVAPSVEQVDGGWRVSYRSVKGLPSWGEMTRVHSDRFTWQGTEPLRFVPTPGEQHPFRVETAGKIAGVRVHADHWVHGESGTVVFRLRLNPDPNVDRKSILGTLGAVEQWVVQTNERVRPEGGPQAVAVVFDPAAETEVRLSPYGSDLRDSDDVWVSEGGSAGKITQLHWLAGLPSRAYGHELKHFAGVPHDGSPGDLLRTSRTVGDDHLHEPGFTKWELDQIRATAASYVAPTVAPRPARLPESVSGSSDPVSDSLPGRPAAMEWHPPADAGSDAGGQLSDGDGYAVPPGFPGYESGVSDAPLNPGGGEPPTGAGRVVVMEVDAEPRTPVPPPATTALAPPEIVKSPAWDGFFQQVLDRAGGQVAETLGLPTVEVDDVRHYLAIELDRIVQRTDIRQRLQLSSPSLEVLRQALDSRGRSVPGLTQVLPHLVLEAFGINFAVSGSETVRHDQGAGPAGAGAGQGRLRRSAGRGPAAAHGGPDSGEVGSESMVQDAGDRAGLPADVAGGWTAGDPPQLTGGYTKKVPLNGDGRLTIKVGGKKPVAGVAAAGQMATVWFGRTDGSHEGEPAAWIKVESLNDRKGGPFWQWLNPAPTEDDLNRLKNYKSPTKRAAGWTAGDPPQLTGGDTIKVPLDRRGQLTIKVGGKQPFPGVAAASQMATVWFGRTDGSPEGEPAAWIKVESVEGRKGGPFWQWLNPAPTEDDLNRLKNYKSPTKLAGGWTAGDPPQMTGGYTKELRLNGRGRLTIRLRGKKPDVGVAAADQMATVWFGRTDGSHEGEPAAWIKVESLNDRDGSPFWRWLDPAPTENDLNRLRDYKSATERAGEWTAGDPPQPTGGYTKKAPLNGQGRLTITLGGKLPGVGVVAADREATVWFGRRRTDGSPEGEPAAWIKVESLDDREGGPFWRWLDPAPTEHDLKRLRTYEPRTGHAGGGTAGGPPLLTGGSSDKAAAVAPASTGSVGVAYRAARDDAVDVPGPNTDDAIPPVAGSWARPAVGIPSQGQQRPGVASAQVDRGQPAVRTPMAAPAPQPPPQPLEGWPQAAAGQAGATQRPANAFWDVAVDRSSLVSVQRPAVASVAGPDPMLPVPADGYCMLYAFIATDPIWVRDVLHPHLPVDLYQFLSDPGRVRTSVVRLVGSEVVPRESPLARVSALLQAHVRGYLDSNAGRLPADVTRQRINFREERVRQVAALHDHQQVLDWLRYLDSPYVTEASMLPAAVIAHRYQAVRAEAMLSGGPLGLGAPTDAPQRQLDFLTQHGQGFPVDVLEPGTARDFLVVVLSQSDRQLEPDELAVVRAAVDNWKQQWGGPVGEFLGPLLAHATGRRVTIWRESGRGTPPKMSDEYGPAAGRPVDLYHVAADPHNPTILNHYNAAAVNDGRQGAGASPAISAPVDTPAWQAQVGQGQPAAQTPSPPQLTATIRSRPNPDQPDPEPRTTPLERHRLDQGRTEVIWADPDEVSAEQDVVLMREITHNIEPDPAMDDAFPLRDPDDPSGRVYAPFADENGQLHPVVRANADLITASMTGGRQILKKIANDPEDPRLPPLPGKVMERLWPLLEQRVAAETRRLVLGESLENPRVKVIRMTADHLMDHERGRDRLEGKWGLGLDDAFVQQSLVELLAGGHAEQSLVELLAGFVVEPLGVHPGGVLEDTRQEAVWAQNHRLYPAYSVTLDISRPFANPDRRSRRRRLVLPRQRKGTIVMSAEGFANSIVFANTALKPGTTEIDRYRTNAVFLQFILRIPDNKNGIRRQEIKVLFGLSNLFDLKINPHRIVIADYGPHYGKGQNFAPSKPSKPIKQEPDTMPPST
ncbi:hypothetical protein ACFY2R_13180 [Micromonospora olivasterospora]|uniref:hypothetical protein n=3 Tax=Micromonospora olivasterospora TaxID=1880 RepID=UPI0036C7944F